MSYLSYDPTRVCDIDAPVTFRRTTKGVPSEPTEDSLSVKAIVTIVDQPKGHGYDTKSMQSNYLMRFLFVGEEEDREAAMAFRLATGDVVEWAGFTLHVVGTAIPQSLTRFDADERIINKSGFGVFADLVV